MCTGLLYGSIFYSCLIPLPPFPFKPTFLQKFLLARHCSKCFICVKLICITAPGDKCHHLHFTDEEMGVQRVLSDLPKMTGIIVSSGAESLV